MRQSGGKIVLLLLLPGSLQGARVVGACSVRDPHGEGVSGRARRKREGMGRGARLFQRGDGESRRAGVYMRKAREVHVQVVDETNQTVPHLVIDANQALVLPFQITFRSRNHIVQNLSKNPASVCVCVCRLFPGRGACRSRTWQYTPSIPLPGIAALSLPSVCAYSLKNTLFQPGGQAWAAATAPAAHAIQSTSCAHKPPLTIHATASIRPAWRRA